MNAKPRESKEMTPAQLELHDAIVKRDVNEFQWRALLNLFPGARPESVLMVVDYCRARKLDPMKKPCHIVPMRVKRAGTREYEWRDVVMPGIYEYRTTAQRTGQYMGHSKPEYGPILDAYGVKAPEWCDFTVFRWSAAAQARTEYPVRTYFAECVGLRDGLANERWKRAPVQMLTKVAEAAALREAFPDELGGEHTAEEMDGVTLEGEVEKPRGKPVVAMPRAKSAQKIDPQLIEGAAETDTPDDEFIAAYDHAEAEHAAD